MAGKKLKMIVSVLFLLSITFAECTVVKDELAEPVQAAEPAADLEAAEANGKLEIIKQIKKVNDDGSYTIGYEADDGSFKIESRDVLGNIKGTYGYIDEHGEIKRVSYSTSNSSETVISTPEPLSVVQRIPAKLNKTVSTTRRPIYLPTQSTVTSTTVTPSTTSVIQTIPRRRIVTSTAIPVTSTKSSTALYETSTPARILAQSKPLVRSTIVEPLPTIKSEGQLLRPEVTLKPTDMPLYRRLNIKTTLLESDTKPVTEDSEIRGNLLRRQLPPDAKNFDPRQHVLNIQQSTGEDNSDVYSSVTTSAPRPLFTTLRPRVVSTTAPPVIHRPLPTVRFPQIYHKPTPRPVSTTELTQQSSTEPSVTVSPVPVVQIPPNNEEQQRQQFVELRHPFHRGAILVPVNHLQSRRVPTQEPGVEYQPQIEPIYVRRVPKFRPIPVHVDEHGFIREVPGQPTPYPIQQRQPHPYVTQSDIINEVDQIRPPVSTRDFQKLLEQLILRQSRLEKISLLTQQDNYYQRPPYHDRPVYPHPPQHPYQHPHQPVQFLPRTQTAQPQQQHPVIVRPQEDPQYNQYAPVTYTPPSNYHPTKRMARLQNPEEEYLPPPVREMLLLRMLQLAINPALPLEVPDNAESATTPQPRKEAVRNVEILGEEDPEQHKRPTRTKRYKEIDIDYFE